MYIDNVTKWHNNGDRRHIKNVKNIVTKWHLHAFGTIIVYNMVKIIFYM